jgi:peptidoglycan/xylan/chitin deacetylase (PgdA/CDA1 family)
VSEAPRVALTFDAEHPDRPARDRGNADRVLDALADADVRATFFVQGRWAEAYPAAAARIARDGHVIGNHSHYHARMPLLHDDGIAADVRAAEAAIVAATGIDPRPWFRAPFGEGHDDPRVLRALEALGYVDVSWDLEVEDWEPWRDADAIREDVVRGVTAGGARVVLLHTWPDGTAGAVDGILRGLADAGVQIVTVDALEGAAT